MARKPRGESKSGQLVLGYLERVSSNVFSDFPDQLAGLVGRRHGIYALYRGDQLYYVGLAGNLRGRIKRHLRDRHAEKWDKFSLYLVRQADHIRELESLILRVANPQGNVTAGRLAASDLKAQLKEEIKREQVRRLRRLLGTKKRGATRRTLQPQKAGQAALAARAKTWFKIRGSRTGKTYEAIVRSDGTIKFKGAIYSSPSGAGKAATGKTTNGWRLWRFQNEKGEWVKLDVLRKKG